MSKRGEEIIIMLLQQIMVTQTQMIATDPRQNRQTRRNAIASRELLLQACSEWRSQTHDA